MDKTQHKVLLCKCKLHLDQLTFIFDGLSDLRSYEVKNLPNEIFCKKKATFPHGNQNSGGSRISKNGVELNTQIKLDITYTRHSS